MPQLEVNPDALEALTPVLATEPVLTLKLAGLLSNNPGGVKQLLVDNLEEPTAVILKAREFYSFFGFDVDAALALLDELPWDQPLAFSGVWEPLVELIAERAEIRWQNPCYQYFLADGEQVLDQLVDLGADVESIVAASDEVIDLILTHWPYGEPGSEADRAHIRDRIENGITAASYDAGHLVGWAMAADDSSLGYLHTVESHRGRGIGLKVAANLTLKVWNAGMTPFCYVVHDNAGPNSVLAQLGYERAPDRFVWFGTGPAQ